MGTRVQRTARGGRLALPETRASWARSRDVAASRLVSSRVARAAERDKAGANQPVSTSSPTAPSPRRRFSARRSGFSFLEKYLEINPLAAGLHQVWRNPHLSTLTL